MDIDFFSPPSSYSFSCCTLSYLLNYSHHYIHLDCYTEHNLCSPERQRCYPLRVQHPYSNTC